MKRVFAILHEPASYTVDRNKAVYDKLGIKYCYMNSASEAKSSESLMDEALNTLTLFSLLKRIRRILKDNEIIIMNGYTGRTFVVLYLLNLVYGRIIGLDSDTQLSIPGNPIKKIIKHIYLSTIFRDKHIFGLPGGTHTHKELFRHYGMDEHRICLMPMMVNDSAFKKRLNNNGNPFKFLFVGRIIPVKNIDMMLKAFVSAFKNIEEVELHIVGNGELLKQLKSSYTEVPNIFFEGPKYGKDLVSEYHKSSALILPSSYEPWGLVVNEALSAGLPVIVSNQVGAAWDLVEDKNTGFIFRYDDAEELADNMRILVNDRELYDKFSQSAYNLMHNYWNYDFYTDCLQKFIYKASTVK